MPVIGLDRVIANFQQLANNSTSQEKFINVISEQTLRLLRDNTPVDTGELRDSWREITRSATTLTIGTRVDQVPKLRALVNGTRYQQPNDFLTPILDAIGDNIESVFRSQFKVSHPYLNNIQGGQMRFGRLNIFGTTGLTGTRGFRKGSSSLHRPRFGFKKLTKKLYRHRKW